MKPYLVWILVGLSALCAACQTDPRPWGHTAGPYRDLEPAISYAASENEMTVLDHTEPAETPGLHVYTLLSIREEPVTLTIQMPDGAPSQRHDQPGLDPVKRTSGPPADPAEIEITAQVGRFGDPARETKLVNSIRKRLRVLERDDGIAK